jgi:hypothetical protein
MILERAKVRNFIKMEIDMMANGNMELNRVLGNIILPLVTYIKDNLKMENLMDTEVISMRME